MSTMSKQEQEDRRKRLVEAVRAIAARDGAVPGVRRFANEVGEKKSIWEGQLWPSWGAFIREAGLEARQMTQANSDDALLACLAKLTREKGSFPSTAQLRFACKTHQGFPTEKVFRSRFGRIAEMPNLLKAWVAGQPDYEDVAALLATTAGPSLPRPARRTPPAGDAQPAYPLSDSYLPPVVACLPELAAGSSQLEFECTKTGRSLNSEFERRVGIALQMLGLDVEGLGQGAGRVADGIASCRQGRWALVYDAKVRRGGFRMGTEDRKFREYVERHAVELERSGIDSIYFAVVSSFFEPKDVERAREVVRLTRAKSFILLEATALLGLVERRLRGPLQEAAELERVFASSGIITGRSVEAVTASRR